MKKLTAPVKGYKIFNPDWTCRNKQYTCPGDFKEDVVLKPCSAGMHFCINLKDCFKYYDNDPNNHCAEVIALGSVFQNDDKCVTDHLQIIREIPWDEMLKMVNQGKDCAGICNTGNWNAGDGNTSNCNTGNCNTGHGNTGNWNSGIRNTGSCNTGDYNTGNYNTGSFNSGDSNCGAYNIGDYNTGDFNSTSFSNGVFCTEEPEIMIFNKPSGMTFRQWQNSEAYCLLNRIRLLPNGWIPENGMTDAEKEQHPEYKITGGYLKILNTSDCYATWWKRLNESERNIIRSIPNFNAAIFKQITGIDQ